MNKCIDIISQYFLLIYQNILILSLFNVFLHALFNIVTHMKWLFAYVMAKLLIEIYVPNKVNNIMNQSHTFSFVYAHIGCDYNVSFM